MDIVYSADKHTLPLKRLYPGETFILPGARSVYMVCKHSTLKPTAPVNTDTVQYVNLACGIVTTVKMDSEYAEMAVMPCKAEVVVTDLCAYLKEDKEENDDA